MSGLKATIRALKAKARARRPAGTMLNAEQTRAAAILYGNMIGNPTDPAELAWARSVLPERDTDTGPPLDLSGKSLHELVELWRDMTGAESCS